MNFMSPVEDIDYLTIEIVPTDRPINVVKAIRSGNVTLLLTKEGKVYGSNAKRVSYLPGVSSVQTSSMRALHRLGVITKAQMERHLDACAELSEAREKRRAAERVQEYADRLGIKLTKAQLAKVERYSPCKGPSQ